MMKRQSQVLLLMLFALFSLTLGVSGQRQVHAVDRPTYVIAFVPLSWRGSRESFETAARSHLDLFVRESNIEAYAHVEIRLLDEGLESTLDDPWVLEEVISFGLEREPADRYVGLTDQDFAPLGYDDVVGMTLGPDSLGAIVEAYQPVITAHELGHTFSLCDEYAFKYWSRQDEEWGCPNPFPPDCEQTIGIVCDGFPAPDGRNSIMVHAGLSGSYAFNQPSYDHLQTVFANLFAAGPVTPPPAPTPPANPEPAPPTLTSRTAVTNPALTLLDETGMRELAPAPAFQPAWSPDGAWIAFAAPYAGNLDIYRVPVAGGAPQRLTGHPSRESHPVWLRNGQDLVFVSDRGGSAALYRLSIASGQVTPLDLPQPANWPAVSADGLQLAFTAAPDGDWNIYRVVLSSSGEITPSTLERLTDAPGLDIAPAWQPDGSLIAFASSRGGSLGLHLLSMADGQVTDLQIPGGATWAPGWLDNERLLYHAYQGRQVNAYVIDFSRETITNLAQDLETAAWPAPYPAPGKR